MGSPIPLIDVFKKMVKAYLFKYMYEKYNEVKVALEFLLLTCRLPTTWYLNAA